MADNSLGFKFPKNRQKIGFLWARSSVRERTPDEWRHRRLTSLACSVARSQSLVTRRILFIAF